MQTPSLTGRKIVDIGHIFEQIKLINNHKSFNCSFTEMEFIEERRFGFYSKYVFKCKMCNIQHIISSENINDSYIPINQATVNGSIAIGMIILLLIIYKI